jgi:acetoin utilization deacetylase AcuC-like enzyme
MTRTGFVGREALGDYDLGADHPLSPLTRELAVGLIRAYGLLDRPDVELIDPQPISDALIEEVHDPAYVAMVKRYADNPMEATSLDAMAWGLAAWGDTPPFAGMHEAARDVWAAPRAQGQGERVLHLQRPGDRDPGHARCGRRTDRLCRRRCPSWRRHPISVL